MKKRHFIILLSVFAFLIVASLASVCYVKNQVKAVDSNDVEKVRVEIPSGTTMHQLASILKDKELIRDKNVFYLCSRYQFFHKIASGKSESFVLKSGVYQLSKSMDINELFDVLKSGKQDYIVVSIPEGLTVTKIAAKLQDSDVCSAKDFIAACSDKEILEKYNIDNELGKCEGFLFPDTYYLTPSMDPKQVVLEMIDNFFEHAKKIDGFDVQDKNKLNETVRLASIIEREYRRTEEAPLISSVFHNRLKINMGLYSCATVEYIITEIEGKPHPEVITYNDLKIDSPYNTYKWAGLPPGAISNPGETALNAAVNPAKTKYYYFRLVDPKTGKHVFTIDFSDHVSEGFSAATKK